jgi:type IV secretory pathway VirJ component
VAIVALGILAIMIGALAVVLARDPLPAGAAAESGPALTRLPLVEVQPTVTAPLPRTLVIYYSGDNGWQDGDKAFVQGFADAGLYVVAIDSLHYFVHGRSRTEATADLSAVIDRYARAWGAQRVVLVGYSFGADAMPIIARGLPARQKAMVAETALIAPLGHGELSLRFYSFFNLAGPDAYDTAHELRGLGQGAKGMGRVVCVYGKEDWLAACPDFSPSLVRAVATPGGHIFTGQRATVSRIIADAAAARVSP